MPTKHLTFTATFLALCKARDDAKAAHYAHMAALNAAETTRVALEDAVAALHEARLASAYASTLEQGVRYDYKPVIDVAVSK